jgi:hypothetical protein
MTAKINPDVAMAVHVLPNEFWFRPDHSRLPDQARTVPHGSASSSSRGRVPAGKSRGRRRKAATSSSASQMRRPSARCGRGMRPSSTMRRKSVAPMPRNAAASSIERPTGSRGQMTEDRFTIQSRAVFR